MLNLTRRPTVVLERDVSKIEIDMEVPPVGAVCELRHPGSGGWQVARILAYYETEWAEEGLAMVVKSPNLFRDHEDGVAILNVDSLLDFREVSLR